MCNTTDGLLVSRAEDSFKAYIEVGVSQNLGYHFGGPHHKDYSILGSIRGSLFRKSTKVELLLMLEIIFRHIFWFPFPYLYCSTSLNLCFRHKDYVAQPGCSSMCSQTSFLSIHLSIDLSIYMYMYMHMHIYIYICTHIHGGVSTNGGPFLYAKTL